MMLKKDTPKRQSILLAVASFLIPMVVVIVVCMLCGITPFGDQSVVLWDMNNQYSRFFSYLKSLFEQGNDLLYTFSKNLGGDMISIAAYYLFSPWNLLLFFFPYEMMPTAVTLLVILKIAASGLTCQIFLQKHGPLAISSLLFSTAYALMSYNLVYCFNIMWLDGVIFLPLIALGIDRMMQKGRISFLYILALAAALAANYYIGYMLCLFCVCYFLYRFVLLCKGPACIKQNLNRVGAFTLSSLLAGALSAVVLIPVFLSLQGTKAGASLSGLTFQSNYPFADVLTKLFPAAHEQGQLLGGLPNIYCSVLVVLLTIVYFANHKFSVKEKILSAGAILVFLVSFHINAFNLIWHGLNLPAGFPYRNAFLFSFVLIYLGHRSFYALKEGLCVKHLWYSIAGAIVVTILLFQKEYTYVGTKSAYLAVALLVLYGVLFHCMIKGCWRSAGIIGCLCLLQLGDLAINTQDILSEHSKMAISTAGYKQYDQQLRPVIEELKERDRSFYRLEKLFFQSNNEPMQFGYAGLNHFSSTEKSFVKDFLKKMGFCKTTDYWAAYNQGSTVSVDSLLGVKYLLSQEGIQKPYISIFAENGIEVFENPYALPIGFVASQQVEEIHLDSEDPFALQNEIFAAMVPQSPQIYTPAQVTVETHKLTAQQNGEYTTYQKEDPSQEAYIRYEIPVSSTQDLYAYFTAPETQNAQLYLNGQSIGAYFDLYRWEVLDLGNAEEGDTVVVELHLTDTALTMGSAYFYYEDLQVLEQDVQALTAQACSWTRLSSSHLMGQVQVDQEEQVLLFSIPYEENWQVWIDGQPVQAEMVMDALMAVPISAGNHTVELRYIPQGFYLGLGITCFTAVVMAAAALVGHRKYAATEPKHRRS